MKKNQKQNWENMIENMNPNNQLELAYILVEQLKINENTLGKEVNYDNQTSKMIRLFLEQLIQKSKNNVDAKKGLEILNQFFNLSEESQRKIIISLSADTTAALKKDELTKRAFECDQTGHIFGEWDSYSIGRKSYDRDSGCDREWDDITWFRNCTNCGYKEETKQCPREVIEKQQEVAKQKQIMKLRMELNALEEKN